MTLLVTQSPGYLEILLGRWGVERLALDILGDVPVDNYLLALGGSRMAGFAAPLSDIDLYGVFVPPIQDLTLLDEVQRVHRHKFCVPAEAGQVMLPVSVEVRSIQRAMQEASNFSGHVWTQIATMARYDQEFMFHENSSKEGGYNVRHVFEDTVVRMAPHLPRCALEPHYRGTLTSVVGRLRKEERRNDRTDFDKFVLRAYYVLAVWRDARVGWPVGEPRWDRLQNMDHAVTPSAFQRLQEAPSQSPATVLAGIEAEYALMDQREPDPASAEQFRTRFKKLVAPALKRLYKF